MANILRVFLSHKAIDYENAKQIVSALRRSGAGNVDVAFSGEKSHFGRDYRDWITDKLEHAEWYILSYTEPTTNWDWCLYEAGYFEACRKRATRKKHSKEWYRVICLHPGDDVPRPLEKFDSVSVNNETSLHTFSHSFLDRVNPTLPADDKLAERLTLSERIESAFLNRIENRYSCPAFRITIPNPASLSSHDLPDDALIEGNREDMVKLFGTNRENIHWGRIKNSTATRDSRWVTQLVHAIMDIANDRTPQQPMTGTIELPITHQSVLPVLYRVDRLENHSYMCEILFPETTCSRWAGLQEPSLRALLTALRMAMRFRYDVVNRFAGKVREISIELGPRSFRRDFRNQLYEILMEAEARGFTSDFGVISDCFTQDERPAIVEMFHEWETNLHPRLASAVGISTDPTVCAEFDDSPLGTDAIKEIEDCLTRLRETNTHFLRMTLKRFQNLLEAGKA